MQFALLGICDASLDLALAVAASQEHELVSICGADSHGQELTELLRASIRTADWESLLSEGQADAAIVAADMLSEARNDQLRKLVQAGLSLILVHPACDAMVGYELEMIASESGSALLPFVRGQQHATVSQAINTVQQGDDSPIGTVEQIVIEHSLHDRNSENVLLALSRDASLLQPMTGRVDEVSAFGPKSGVQNYSALSVNMTGATKIPLRWSVVPAASSDGTVVTLVGAQGRMVLFMQGDPSMWTLQGSDVATDSSDHSDEDASLLVADFERLVAGEDGPFFSWSDACRTMEIHTAVRDSLRRGRKIRLYDDQYSEQQTFKGKMAVGGCSLLMLALLFLFGFAIFDGISMPFRDREASPGDPAETTSVWIRLWPAYPLLAFLVLQLLKLVFISDRTASKQPRRSETANAPPQA